MIASGYEKWNVLANSMFGSFIVLAQIAKVGGDC
jgi:hypothetical protein